MFLDHNLKFSYENTFLFNNLFLTFIHDYVMILLIHHSNTVIRERVIQARIQIKVLAEINLLLEDIRKK